MNPLGDQLPQVIGLLQQLQVQATRQLLPAVQGSALECLQQAMPVLDRLSIDLSVIAAPAVLQEQARTIFAEIDEMLGLYRADDRPTAQARPVVLQQALVSRLRQLAVRVPNTEDRLRPDGELWQRAADLAASLRVAIEAQRPPPFAEPPPAGAAITPERLRAYLHRHWPDAPDLDVVSLQLLNGGRSKKTVFATLAGHPVIDEMVLRQDVTTGMIDSLDGETRVASEWPLLRAAYDAGLPVAEPLWLETDLTDLGPPFMITRKRPGTTPGDWRGFHQPHEAATFKAVEHLAEVLAQLHQLPLTSSDQRESTAQRMQREIDYRWNKWQQDALAPFPLIDCAFQRLRVACREGLGAAVLVHGDVLPHNLLFAEGRVSALLDWEFAHVGDPAEDLAYCRAAVSAVMPWAHFIDRYLAAGGPVVSERRLAIFGLYGLVRNCGLIASAGRLYAEGKVDDFGTGVIAYVSLPMMETFIAAQLKALDALEGAR